MITDPEQIEQIVSQATPRALLRSFPWWLAETAAMAVETWLAEQDRAGINISPSIPVPAGKAEGKLVLTAVGFLNETQTVEMIVRKSVNNGVSFEDAGSGVFPGGVVPIGKNGQPGERTLTAFLTPGMYPTHLQIELRIAGSVNCGVTLDWIAPPP